MAVANKIGKLIGAVRRYGAGGVLPYFVSFSRKRRDISDYDKWVKLHTIDDRRREEIRKKIDDLELRPLISIILPVYDVEERWLSKCIESVTNQIYTNWELCIADDASKREYIRPFIEKYASIDDRIKAVFRPLNGHISAASNSALDMVTGEFVVLLDHDDELSEDALFWVAKELNDRPNTAMIYSDEDLINENGVRSDPKFKPDLSRELLYSMNMVTHLSAYRTDVVRKIGGFRIGLEGSQDYDLALRVIEQIPETAIRHIPRVLYHWRSIPTSVAGNAGAKPYAFAKARDAIASHFERTGIDAAVEPAVDDLNRVRYRLPDPPPTVALIVNGEPAADLRRTTDYPRLDIITSDPSQNLPEQLNIAAASGKQDVLCFLDRGLMPLAGNWLSEMVSFALHGEIGAVGAKLLNPNGSIDQTGLVFGGDQLVRKAHNGLPRDNGGNFFRAALIGNYSAVSWRCLVIRRSVFEEIGGFDPRSFPVSLFDADLCLGVGKAGYRVVYTPYAELIGTIASNDITPADSEITNFRGRWKTVLDRDPFYNPNFTDEGETFRYRV